jgi:alkanesulfonate monooxygenase SsuD/methylene tetrahydromethanopterin reductase-like flavin-dependent oxidoreductase (luciferase family)
MAESIDEISEGRFILGVGAGWHQPEYEMFHLPWSHRFGRFKDSISIINPLLRTGRADYEGEYFSATEAMNLPGGPRRAEGGPPILVGTNGPKTMRLAAQFADAWNSDWHHDPSTVLPRLAELDKACEDVGRDPKTIVRTSGSNVAMPGYLGRRANPMEGNPEQIAEQIAAFRDIGLRHWVAGLDPCNPAKIEEFSKVIDILDRS